jgi:hypothetical protein
VPIDELRQKYFPNLSPEARETSPQDDCYNCIAWAAGDIDHHWWPVDFPTNGVYWPLQPQDDVDGFIAAFMTLGYEPCNDGDPEPGFEKLAIYVDGNGDPSHMARSLPSGKWTSKVGQILEDIEHPTAEEICGKTYGSIARFMKRPMPWTN